MLLFSIRIFNNYVLTGVHTRTGKVKGIDRFLGTMDNLEPHLIEVTSGEAKYEHHHRAVVWRMPRLPKEGQGIQSCRSAAIMILMRTKSDVILNHRFFACRRVHYAQPCLPHDPNVVRPSSRGTRQILLRGVYDAYHASIAHHRQVGFYR